ncbi:hypothetical protein [Nonlabens sp. Asnod3-A02]|uniref:hypothetical protein n=1 Tax=Nonlabens sp. Asnod3-A02 TaxID=3160579 RepID=UPI003863CDE5
MNLELVSIEKIKNYLVIKYSGITGIGSLGNNDIDFILKSSRENLIEQKNIQGIIFDFSKMRYEFCNRFSKIFNSNEYKPNKKIYIRIIPNENDYENWNSLIEKCTSYQNHIFIQVDKLQAIKSINKEMN